MRDSIRMIICIRQKLANTLHSLNLAFNIYSLSK